MSVLVEFSMAPLDKGVSLSSYVARSLDIVDRSGLPYRFNAMGTVIEGEWDECMKVLTECYRRMAEDCERITCDVKIDARRGPAGRLDAKIASVEAKLGRSLRK